MSARFFLVLAILVGSVQASAAPDERLNESAEQRPAARPNGPVKGNGLSLIPDYEKPSDQNLVKGAVEAKIKRELEAMPLSDLPPGSKLDLGNRNIAMRTRCLGHMEIEVPTKKGVSPLTLLECNVCSDDEFGVTKGLPLGILEIIRTEPGGQGDGLNYLRIRAKTESNARVSLHCGSKKLENISVSGFAEGLASKGISVELGEIVKPSESSQALEPRGSRR